MSESQWQAMAPRWERGRELLWASTRVVSEWLVSRLKPEPGQVVLDLAAGTGETGFLAAARLGSSGRLISADRERGMVEAAERLGSRLGVTNAEYRVLDGAALDLPDASIDGALSRFGYILKGDPPAALGELRRVLRPGGRLAFAVWAERSRNAWISVPADVMAERGHLRPEAGEGERLSARRNPDAIRGLLNDAGFGEPEIEELSVPYRFADSDELWFFVSELRGPVALALADLDESEQNAVRAEVESRATRTGNGFELAGVSLNVVVS